jgi:hypothetical protein
VDAACGHLAQRRVDDLPLAARQQELERRSLRELRCAAEAAVAGVEALAQVLDGVLQRLLCDRAGARRKARRA